MLDNPYGRSKKDGEDAVLAYAQEKGVMAYVFRLPNVFGKWSRPNYNSVVSTFCHNVAHDLPLQVHYPSRELILVHIDEVVGAFLDAMAGRVVSGDGEGFCIVPLEFRTTLGALAETIQSFRKSRTSLELPQVADPLTRRLYSTYLTYLPEDQFSYALTQHRDPRGWLGEFLRGPDIGQIFVSVTHPGITRGNHWHHTKTEKFLVVQGRALIRFRAIDGDRILEYPVSGEELQVVDIPPGYTHCIVNTGTTDLVTVFWASESFDPARPDTTPMAVDSHPC
jgi:UDP-2-acetamido-2,6-beta-L-arabino-hexul-4-ose reductase